MGIKVLAIDDEPDILELLKNSFEFAGFELTGAKNSQEGLDLAVNGDFDVIICDVMLPDFDGFTMVTRLRDMKITTPVIFLTAKDSTDNKVHGLTLGADDYLVKPFSIEELIARVKVQANHGKLAEEEKINSTERIEIQDLIIDTATHEVYRGDTIIELSPREYELLLYLALNSGRIITKRQILDEVWDNDWSSDFSVIEAYISYLRKKVDSFEGKPKLIITKRSAGYMIR
ncbi:MAG: response regulator transcription factor [Candidatus Ancillula sp.]|jgi:two-component system OmpR family response regulator|nr:response regulator transcription factor [Candidatus Ancillula sp.]